MESHWRKGPLPPNSWNWGGVVLYNSDGTVGQGFHFADFHGDHVCLVVDKKLVLAHEVAYYNNCLDLSYQDAVTEESRRTKEIKAAHAPKEVSAVVNAPKRKVKAKAKKRR